MPPINISPKVRFWLYIAGAVAAPLVTYLFAKGYIGKEEVALAGSYLALLTVLAATKTNLSDTAAQAEDADATVTALAARADLPKRIPPTDPPDAA